LKTEWGASQRGCNPFTIRQSQSRQRKKSYETCSPLSQSVTLSPKL